MGSVMYSSAAWVYPPCRHKQAEANKQSRSRCETAARTHAHHRGEGWALLCCAAVLLWLLLWLLS